MAVLPARQDPSQGIPRSEMSTFVDYLFFSYMPRIPFLFVCPGLTPICATDCPSSKPLTTAAVRSKPRSPQVPRGYQHLSPRVVPVGFDQAILDGRPHHPVVKLTDHKNACPYFLYSLFSSFFLALFLFFSS